MSDDIPDSQYHAIEPKDRAPARALVLRLASGETVHLKYPDIHLKRVAPDQTAMAVFCYSINVVMWGRGLGQIALAMDGENIAWVQEFNAERWDRPNDPHAVIVERIAIYTKKDEDADKAGEAPHTREAERTAKH